MEDTFKCSEEAAIKCLQTCREGARKLLIVASNDCTISIRDAQNALFIRSITGHKKSPMHMQVKNSTNQSWIFMIFFSGRISSFSF